MSEAIKQTVGIYLGAGKAYHSTYNIVYQDIDGTRDIGGDMLLVDLSGYDYIIATPPCNFWSRARGKTVSKYSLMTLHLLPCIIDKLVALGKPFIVENVSNIKRFKEFDICPRSDCFNYKIGRHMYFTNIKLDIDGIQQRQDFKYGGYVIRYDDMDDAYHQGGYNVYQVIERFLQTVHQAVR